MSYNRKQLRQITGLPDKTLRWLLDKLEIQPVDIEYTLFKSPIYLYDESVLDILHAYIFERSEYKLEHLRGKRCRGGCDRFLPNSELNSQQICDHCRRRQWLFNEITHGDPLNTPIDLDVVDDITNTLKIITTPPPNPTLPSIYGN